jgi:hypothetical protein
MTLGDEVSIYELLTFKVKAASPQIRALSNTENFPGVRSAVLQAPQAFCLPPSVRLLEADADVPKSTELAVFVFDIPDYRPYIPCSARLP